MTEESDVISQRLKASPEVVTCEFGEGVALLNLKKNVYYSLNSVGADIWELIQDSSSREDIHKYISERFQVEEDVCGPDIERLLSDLQKNNLLTVS